MPGAAVVDNVARLAEAARAPPAVVVIHVWFIV